ncbi:MAG: SMC family ATPase [Ktedonobacterales bacterium]|nr:SMC family ATPase [Ktedonobacterales bacterium]
MQITSITLENIKSYRRAVIHLSPGTTAIRGHNGAGKSTLVEAIGYALFDFLPYSPAARFIREGEKVSKVVVGFISALDERLYEVERRCVISGSAAWFVVDPELRHKVVEGKDDTLAFLRLHLGVQTTLPLSDLFDNAIAVQQGTFTADFLGTAAVRRKKFDALLQIEEYRQAADNLRDTVSHLKDTLATHDHAIAALTARTMEVETWRQGRATLTTERVATLELIEHLTTQREAVSARIQVAQRRRDELAQLQGERDRAHAAWELATAHHAQAQAEADRAAAAQARCAATHDDYQRHTAAQADLARAQVDARLLNEHQLAHTKAEHALHEHAQALTRATEQLHTAQAAADVAASLIPHVQRQGEMEAQIAAAKEAHNRLIQLRADHHEAVSDQAAIKREAQATDADIAQLTAREPLARELTERAARLSALQSAAAARAERQKRQATLRDHLSRQREAVQRAAAALHASETQWQAAQAAHTASTELPAREAALATLTTKVALLKAEIHQTETSLHSAENGHCPFLKEPCQNLKQRGIRSLDVFFGDQLTLLGGQLHPLEAQQAALTREVAAMRQHRNQAERLDEYAQRVAQARADHAEQTADLHRLLDEQATLAHDEQGAATLAADLRAANQAVEESTRADRDCARLPTLHAQRAALTTRLHQCEQRLAALASDISAAEARAATRATLTDALGALGNPRERLAIATAAAQKIPDIEREIASHTARHARATTAVAEALAQLAPFAGLDARVATLQAALAASKAAHDDFLRHEAEAQQLPERRQRATLTQAAVDATAATLATATTHYDAAAQSLDVTELDRLAGELHDLDDHVATNRERARQHKEAIVALERQLTEAERWLTELADVQSQRGATEATFSLLHYCRDTIKEAGPFVMRALLREISATANRIFGEIMGDRSATLTWQDDYDITIRNGAYERHFAQLSGGEQMSAALAVRLALLKTLTRATIAFFDEPTQNMDDERRANLAGQIRRVTGFEQLLVISHDDTFEEGLDAVIRVRKDGGESQVESDPGAMLPAPLIPFPTALSA